MPHVVMPRLTDSMEEGTIVTWLKASGDEVEPGEAIVEIETDKATMAYEADVRGVLSIIAEQGTTVAVGGLIATIGDASVAVAAAPAAVPAAEAALTHAPVRDTHAAVSPVARRLARELGVDLTTVRGSGPRSRVVKADVEAAAAAPPTAEDVRGAPTFEDLSSVQRTVARRMTESSTTIPAFHVSTKADMRAAITARGKLKALASGAEPVPSFNDLVVKATALALREHPRANASFAEGRFALHSRVNVGIAVAAEDALIVPTIFDADRKSLAEIAVESRVLADRVRSGTITPPELAGQTFTVSNLGMFGITAFGAIVNPPQAAILAVGAIQKLPVVEDGTIVPGATMTLTLTSDHRILYGADSARFLARIRDLLEAPLALAR